MKKVLAIIVILALVVLGWWLWSRDNEPAVETGAWLASGSAVNISTNPEEGKIIDGVTKDTGKGIYRNNQYAFQLHYPPGLTHQEYDEGQGATSIVFEDAKTRAGFQIFVTPYDLDYISEDRLKRDIPSGVVEDQQEVMIAGSRGAIFFSKNPVMGETREVWFIRDGYLYEVATYRQLDAWLSQIMTTWQWL